MRITMDFDPYFEIADSERSYTEKLAAYEKLADEHFEQERFEEFMAKQLPHLDQVMWELARSPEFDRMLVQTVTDTFPPYEPERFIAHYRGLIKHWVEAEAAG